MALLLLLAICGIAFIVYCVWLTTQIHGWKQRALMVAINLVAVAVALLALGWIFHFED